MLKLSSCKIRVSDTFDIAAGVVSLEEGLGLIAVRENGKLKVKAGLGAADTEEFAGISLSERTAPTIFPLILTEAVVVLLETGKWGVRLPRPIVGTPQIRYAATNVALTLYTADSDSLLEAGEYQPSSDYIQVVEADLGKKLNVIANYAPTIQDMHTLGGDNSPTTFAPMTSVLGATSAITSGTVYTSNYDVTIDWANWTPAVGLKVKANGVIGSGTGTGATIKGRVVEAPTQEQPFLGFEFSVA